MATSINQEFTAGPWFRLAQTAYGHMLVLVNDQPRGQALLATGRAPDHEEIEMLCGLLRNRSRPVKGDGFTIFPGKPIAIDVGANMGTHTLAFADICDRVYSFEPQPVFADLLLRNVVLNHRASRAVVRVIPMAAGASRAARYVPQLPYDTPADYGCVALRDAPGESTMLVEEVTLDDLFPDLERLDLIKIDVEGMEREVLDGAANLIHEHHPILFVEWLRSDRAALESQLSRLGYTDIRVVGLNLLAQFAR